MSKATSVLFNKFIISLKKLFKFVIFTLFLSVLITDNKILYFLGLPIIYDS